MSFFFTDTPREPASLLIQATGNHYSHAWPADLLGLAFLASVKMPDQHIKFTQNDNNFDNLVFIQMKTLLLCMLPWP